MIGLIWRLIVGMFHQHAWSIIDTRTLGRIGSEETGTRYVLQCTKCGDVKKRDLI